MKKNVKVFLKKSEEYLCPATVVAEKHGLMFWYIQDRVKSIRKVKYQKPVKSNKYSFVGGA